MAMTASRRPLSWILALLGALAVLSAGVSTTAQDAPPARPSSKAPLVFPEDDQLRAVVLEPRLRKLLESLGDPSWKVRSQATSELVANRFSNEQLLAGLRQLDLGVEQRARVLAVLSRRILEAPSGAVGIRMSSGLGEQGGVRIEAVIEGMPAAGLLKAGDLIVAIDDQPVRRSSDLTSIVQSKLPGETITVDIKRNRIDQDGDFLLDEKGQVRREDLQVFFALGSIAQLATDGGNVVRSSTVRSARARWVQTMLDRFAPDPLRVRLPANGVVEESFVSRPIDDHPALVWLSSVSAAVERGILEPDDTLRFQVSSRLDALRSQRSDPRLSSEERAWLERVITRYVELSEWSRK